MDTANHGLVRGELVAGRWEVGDELARGGSSVVHGGVDLETGRAVALKLLVPPPERAAQSLARLRREARVLSSIRHPVVVEFIALVEELERAIVVLERVRGPTLEERVERDGPLDPEAVAALASSLAAALAAVHAEAALHRDIKPANVILGAGGAIRLVDFGSVQFHGDAALTAPGEWAGTPMFAAPEVVLGGAADPRSDLYALGLTLYFALTGTLPERTLESGAVRAAPHGHRPSSAAAGVPPWLDALVRRATMADPRLRFPTAESLRRALEVRSPTSSAGPISRRRDRLCLGCGAEAGPEHAFCGACRLDDGDGIRLVLEPIDAGRRSSQVTRLLALSATLDPAAAREVLEGLRPLTRVPPAKAASLARFLEAEGLAARPVTVGELIVRGVHARARGLAVPAAAAGALAFAWGVAPLVAGGVVGAATLALALWRTLASLRPLADREETGLAAPLRSSLARAIVAVRAPELRALLQDVITLATEHARDASALGDGVRALLEAVAEAAVTLGRAERLHDRLTSLGVEEGPLMEARAQAESLRAALTARLLGVLATLGALSGLEAAEGGEVDRLTAARRAVEGEVALRREALREVEALLSR